MTDRAKGCWVAFDKDIRVDDVQDIVNAIKQIRRVENVELSISNSDDWMARQNVKSELRDAFLKLFDAL